MTRTERGLEAALQYVREEFSDASVIDASRTTHQGVVVSVLTVDMARPMVTVFTYDFLQMDSADIQRSLRLWGLAESLRAFGPGHHVTVDVSGLLLA